MKRVEMLELASSDEDKLLYRIEEQGVRIRELEYLVHALLRDRTHQEFADAWLEVTGGQKNTFNPSITAIVGHGKRMAANLDRWPDKQKWSPPAWTETTD